MPICKNSEIRQVDVELSGSACGEKELMVGIPQNRDVEAGESLC